MRNLTPYLIDYPQRDYPQRPKMKLLLIAPLLCTVAILAGCDKPQPVAGPAVAKISAPAIEGETIIFTKDSPQLATLQTIAAVQERESFVRINGRTGWDETRTARVLTPLAGRVIEIRATAGALVKKGQVLAVISSPDFGVVQAEARRSETDLQLADKQLQRARDLVAAGVMPQKELQLNEAEFARAKNERQRTQSKERAFGTVGGNLIDQKFQLISPVAGMVVDRKITPGQEVRPDQAVDQPLFVISEPTRLWVTLDVPESLTQEISVGEQVRISVPSLPGEVFNARVEYVADYIDSQSRTVKARAAVDNIARRLKAEMYVTADVAVPPSKALKVPSNAVYLLGDKYYAFVEQPTGTFTRRTLKAEEATLGFVRIVSGVFPGDKLVSDGALLLQQLLNAKATAPAAKTGSAAETKQADDKKP
jgi:membrane fusion protein, heavy metal efflux system